MKFTINQGSRQGPRQYNQDKIAYSYSREALLVVLADGMGGHRNGDVAAQIAIKTLTDAFQRLALPALLSPASFLRDTIMLAHQAILDYVVAHNLLDHPRTTIVAAIAQDDALHIAHVGDSRLYHIRDSQVLYRTEDHSKVQLMFRRGLLSLGQMGLHPERNKIYNCLGGDVSPKVEVSPRRELRDGDTVMLCSDGVWSLVGDEKMAEILCDDTVNTSIATLLDLAESRADAKSDNMSAIAFNWGGIVSRGTVSTATMPLDSVTTILMNPRHPEEESEPEGEPPPDEVELSEDEIENAIAEIQAALRKVQK